MAKLESAGKFSARTCLSHENFGLLTSLSSTMYFTVSSSFLYGAALTKIKATSLSSPFFPSSNGVVHNLVAAPRIVKGNGMALKIRKKLLLAFCRSQQPLLLPHWCEAVRPLAQELLLPLEATGHNSRTTSMMAAQVVVDMCFDLQRPVAASFFAPLLSIWILEGWIQLLRLRPLFIYQVNYFRRTKQRTITS